MILQVSLNVQFIVTKRYPYSQMLNKQININIPVHGHLLH